MDESVRKLSTLKIVILKAPYLIWLKHQEQNISEFNSLFTRMMQLKLRGYSVEYPEGVLPIDTSDFFADHILICVNEREGLRPVSGIKSTRLSQCEKHRVPFPALSLVQQAQSKEHIDVVTQLINECQNKRKQLAYTGAWTIDPEIRKNRPLTKEITKVFRAAYVFHHLHEKVDQILVGGTMRFKAHHFFGEMGHNPLCNKSNEELNPILVRHLFDERVQVQHLLEFTPETLDLIKPYEFHWQNRIEINADLIGARNLRLAS